MLTTYKSLPGRRNLRVNVTDRKELPVRRSAGLITSDNPRGIWTERRSGWVGGGFWNAAGRRNWQKVPEIERSSIFPSTLGLNESQRA